MMRWLATRLHGDGTESLVADELPVAGGRVQRALSGPGGVSGTIPVEVARLAGTREAAEQAMLAVSGKTRIVYGDAVPVPDVTALWLRGSGRVPHVYHVPGGFGGLAFGEGVFGGEEGGTGRWVPATDPALLAAAQIEHERVLVPGITGLYCLTDHGAVLGGGILTEDSARAGAVFDLDARGHAGFLAGAPYDGDRQWIGVDPADLIRHAWAHVQGRARHDLGVTVDATTTPVRVGEEERDVSFETGAGERVDFTAGPVKWNYWTTHDLGREVDRLAVETPIDYAMAHTWDARHSTMSHRLRLGYPRLGRRRPDLNFTVGVNVIDEPAVEGGGAVSDVLVLGAGEGSEARRGRAHRPGKTLGRTVVIVDKTLTSNSACAAVAQQHLDWLAGSDEISTLTVADHPNAPLGSWQVGDDIRIQGNDAGWAGGLDLWVRVLSDELDPETGRATLTVTRAERTQR